MDDVTNRLFKYFDFNLWICMQRQYSRAPDCNACSITTVFPLLFLVLALLTFCLLDLLNNLIFFCYVSKKKDTDKNNGRNKRRVLRPNTNVHKFFCLGTE